MTRIPLVVGNWKLNHNPKDAETYLSKFCRKLPSEGIDVGIAPTTLALESAVRARTALSSTLLLFAQDICFAETGAFTGETSSSMIKGLGVDGTLLGHSERRQLFGETNDRISQKLTLALKHQLKVILCIGETLAERDSQKTREVCLHQLGEGLNRVTATQMDQIAIAYEPVWAIGTGRNATAAQAEEVHQWIRSFIWDRLGQTVAAKTRILYGGSVKPEITVELMKQPNIDGLLVGGASLKTDDFMSIIQSSLGVKDK